MGLRRVPATTFLSFSTHATTTYSNRQTDRHDITVTYTPDGYVNDVRVRSNGFANCVGVCRLEKVSFVAYVTMKIVLSKCVHKDMATAELILCTRVGFSRSFPRGTVPMKFQAAFQHGTTTNTVRVV
jgi:hypothetical protein